MKSHSPPSCAFHFPLARPAHQAMSQLFSQLSDTDRVGACKTLLPACLLTLLLAAFKVALLEYPAATNPYSPVVVTVEIVRLKQLNLPRGPQYKSFS
jgi:hypothetical protein